MRQNMPDVNSTTIKVNDGDQSVFIAANVENDPILNFIGRGKCSPQFGEAVKLSLFHDLEPPDKPGLAVRMFFPELDQGLAGNDMHKESISQIEINIKRPGAAREYCPNLFPLPTKIWYTH